jgi:ferric-dicitrate binding protein FerR (iron transport regulator)
MTQEQALQVIEQALNASTQKGVFNLKDVATILQALQKLKEQQNN